MDLNSKHHVWRKSGTAHHMQSTIPKVRCTGSSLMLWVCFSAEGTEGLVRVEEKFNAPKYRDSLNENPVQCIQNFRRAEGLPSKSTMDLNTQQEWLIDNSVYVFGGPSKSLILNSVKYFWRNMKMCVCSLPTWQSLTGEVVRRRIAENRQMLKTLKPLSHQTKNTWGCKGASAKYLVKGMNVLI